MITDEEIRAIARLARLDLSHEEIALQREHINALLERIRAIQTLPLDGVEPTSHCLEITDVLRDDEAAPSLDREHVLENAPESRDGFFIVPRILEG